MFLDTNQIPKTHIDNNSLIEKLDTSLVNHFSNIFTVDNNLTRKIVSFQANKGERYYRWYKYKEAFSSSLVKYLFNKYPVNKGKILDPFSGSGTALFSCSQLGYDADGIEILPVGQKIIEANILARSRYKKDITTRLKYWLSKATWNSKGKTKDFEVLRITKGAYSKDTNYRIKRYLYELHYESPEVQKMLIFSLLCVLETISYTRKDGQFLRWDYRSGRGNRNNMFNKGEIVSFDQAIENKLTEIINDINTKDSYNLNFFSSIKKNIKSGKIQLLKGSCLNLLPNIRDEYYTGIITSPPYCNRYDYTRTYALEHALLGIKEEELFSLRQSLLSCTVENRTKNLLSLNKKWKKAINTCNQIQLLYTILNYLDYKKAKKELNNNGISQMVRGYFYEMACVIQDCYRILKNGSYMFMVNDNVKYAGVSISVDIICSKIAEDLGFKIKNILILPQSKGNSSQQMDKYGKEYLRKCVYVWKKES